MLILLWYILQLLAILGGIVLTVYVLFEKYRIKSISSYQRKLMWGGIVLLIIGFLPIFLQPEKSDPLELRMVGAYQQMDDPRIVVHLKSDGTFYTNCSNYQSNRGSWLATNDNEKLAVITLENEKGKTIDELTVDWFDGRMQLRSSNSYLNFVKQKLDDKN